MMLLQRLSRHSAQALAEAPAADILFNGCRQYFRLAYVSTNLAARLNGTIQPAASALAADVRLVAPASTVVPALLSSFQPQTGTSAYHSMSQPAKPQSSTGRSWANGTAFSSLLIGTATLFTSSAAIAKDPAEVPVAPSAPKGDEYDLPTALKGLPKDIVVYQYEVCPFCNKVKVVLDYYKLPYKTVEVNPLTKSELKWSQYKKVPVVLLDGEAVNDSSRIVSHLAAEVRAAKEAGKVEETVESKPASSWFSKPKPSPPSPAAVPGGVSSEEEKEWRKWVDSRLVKVMTANIYRNWNETWQSFSYITDHSQWGLVSRELAKYAGAVLMWQIGGRMPKKYGIEGDLREALYSELNKFVDAVGDRRFLGGNEPNLADLAVFGVLKCIKGTPTHNDLLAFSHIKPWYERMGEAVGESLEQPLKEPPVL